MGGAIGSLLSRPFAERRVDGRRLAYISLACGIIACSLLSYAADATNVPKRAYLIGTVQMAFALAAVIAYIPRPSRPGDTHKNIS
jgi:hypothetical protein